MLHPRLTSVDGAQTAWLATVGPYGSWGDLTYTTRWGAGMCGMYEASWTMPLPAQFEHPLLRRGTQVELMDGPYRVGSPLVLSEPAVGTGLADPWTLTCEGIGREVEGSDSYYCFDGAGETTTVPSTAVDQAMARGSGWRIAGRNSNVPTGAIGGSSTTDELMSLGSLLNSVDDLFGVHHAIDSDNILTFIADPTTPTYQVTPGAVALGTADDGYATVVYVRYYDSATLTYKTVLSPTTISATETRFGRKEYAANLIPLDTMSTATAQAYADGILARTKGRLAWTNRLVLTPNELLTIGGVPANLSKVAEDVGGGCMVRLHGIWSDLLETTGETWTDIIIGEARMVDGGSTIDLAPAGLAPRDFAAIVESVTGMAASAA